MSSNISFSANPRFLKTDTVGRLIKDGEVYLKQGDKYFVCHGEPASAEIAIRYGHQPSSGKFLSAVKADAESDTVHIVGTDIENNIQQDKVDGGLEIFNLNDFEQFIAESKNKFDEIINSLNKKLQKTKDLK